ncbi:MAG: hypothetical protein V1772_02065, partial [Chloroflexota bacterium]
MGFARALLDRSLGMLHGEECGLRIKLHIDPEDPSLAALASPSACRGMISAPPTTPFGVPLARLYDVPVSVLVCGASGRRTMDFYSAELGFRRLEELRRAGQI